MLNMLISPTRCVDLDKYVDAEWISSPNSRLRVSFAAPGFARLFTVDVPEPYASAIWEQLMGSTPELKPAPEPARQPDRPNGREIPRRDPGYSQSNGNGHLNGNGNGQGHRNGGFDGLPKSGKALYVWAKQMDEEEDVNLSGFLAGWAKRNGISGRWADWHKEDVEAAVKAAEKYLRSTTEASRS